MDDLNRFAACLQRLQNSVEGGTRVTYAEFLQRLVKLREQVTMQVIEAKSVLYKTKELRDNMRDEYAEAIRCVAPEYSADFRALLLKNNSRTPVKTPLSARKRLTADASRLVRSLIEQDEIVATPGRRTPLSGKRILMNKFAPRCTPLSSAKKVRFSAMKRKSLDYLDATPEMPKHRKSKAKFSVALNRHEPKLLSFSKQLDESRAETTDRVDSISVEVGTLAVPDATPTMKERVSFFSNPNVANIHKRYVAIQDSKAEESTCLVLPHIHMPKKSSTPPLPMSSQKKKRNFNTPLRKESHTPPLPMSSQKKKSHFNTPNHSKENNTPPKPVSSTKKSTVRSTPEKPFETSVVARFSKTPSPPRMRSKPSARKCLDSKLSDLTDYSILPPLSDNIDCMEITSSIKFIDDIDRKMETTRVDEETTRLNMELNVRPPVDLSSTPVLRPRPRITMAKAPLNFTNNERTMPLPKINKVAETRKEVTEQLRPPVKEKKAIKFVKDLTKSNRNNEERTVPLRPSKMLRNQGS